MDDPVYDLLVRLAMTEFHSEEEAAGALLSAAIMVNSEVPRLEATEDLGTRQDHIRRWLERLFKIAKNATSQFGAASFSISVGIPTGVTVTVEWNTEE